MFICLKVIFKGFQTMSAMQLFNLILIYVKRFPLKMKKNDLYLKKN
jgi:hypothetical protein